MNKYFYRQSITMGSEQSQQSAPGAGSASHASTPAAQRRSGSIHQPHPAPRPFTTGSRFQRGNTIAVTGQANDQDFTAGPQSSLAFRADSRPVSPPMSVCSDSDLPYISYTDKPIGGNFQVQQKKTFLSKQYEVYNYYDFSYN